MSTAHLPAARRRLPARAAASRTFVARPALSSPRVLCSCLLVIILYAAFAHGAVSLASATRVELAVVAVAAAAGAAWFWTGSLRVAAPAPALAGALLLAAFAAWNGVTLIWSVAPDQTWIELNRALAYLAALAVAIAAGASDERTLQTVGRGFLGIAALVTAYALGQKLVPGLHIPGLFTLNQTGPLPRLQEPLGYWNALALFVVFGVPLALALVLDRQLSPRTRVGLVCATSAMLVVIAFTYSRGGLIALAVGVLVGGLGSGQRLRWWLAAAAAVLGALPAVVVGLSSAPLTTAGVSLSRRESAGALLLLVLAVSLAGLAVVAQLAIAREPAWRMNRDRTPRLRKLGWLCAGLAVLGVLLAITFSSRGFAGTFSHAWRSFTTTRATSDYNPHRLLSADSENRWVWWKEAAGAFGDRPLGGWGAGSFGVVHLLYRRDTLSVQQPHSVPLQFLSDTGIVGALLATGAFAFLFVAARRGVRRAPLPGQRALAAALVAGGTAYVVHSLYDWDWNIPAVTLPALIFLGVVAGSGARARREPPGSSPIDLRRAWRAPALAGLTLWLCLFGLSIELPELAASNASAALVRAASSSPAALATARSSAAQAARLDPLSDAGPLAEATVALHGGRLVKAHGYLLEALRREPTDEHAWAQLVYVDKLLGNRPEVVLATQRILDLDPRGSIGSYEFGLQLLAAPPGASATAIPTPPLPHLAQLPAP